MAEEQVAAKGDAGKKIGRGVSYPVIGLEDAIEKARTFHREERKSAAPVASAIKHFGYSESSSGGRQTVATLIQFGLLEDEGRSENRHVRLTDRALTIRLEAPRRVRGKTEHEGSWWVFVEGSETGIPMEEVSVIERKATDPVVPKQLPPSMPLQPITVGTVPLQPAPLVGEQQVASGKFGKSMSYRLLATGEIGAKELGKIIKLLEAYKLALEDEDEDEEL